MRNNEVGFVCGHLNLMELVVKPALFSRRFYFCYGNCFKEDFCNEKSNLEYGLSLGSRPR